MILDLDKLDKIGHGTVILEKCNDIYDTYLDDNHIIQNRCKFYGIDNPELKCDLFF